MLATSVIEVESPFLIKKYVITSSTTVVIQPSTIWVHVTALCKQMFVTQAEDFFLLTKQYVIISTTIVLRLSGVDYMGTYPGTEQTTNIIEPVGSFLS